ncbi:hypothetical protein [Aureispira anguillae]|uniref:Uncharacterized protein n=1 Tax=Aureispira anguillae TaxID=2864201 RepID=A0A915YJZ4_9BACT|nr:hypothetical protein [Aureispira anguillae]BDS14362.1 hypothetical protein AsAng_0051410 [Aureispira anguillae]
MYKSKLIAIYQCFNRTELEALHKWVKSPLHNSDEQVTKLLFYISSRRKHSKLSLSKERIFKQLFPDRLYDDLTLRRLMSKTTKIMEEFVHFLMSKKDISNQHKQLSEFLNSRQQPQLAQKQLSKGKKKLLTQKEKTHSYYYQFYQLEQEEFEQTASHNRMQMTNLQVIFDHLSIAFILENLRYACIAISHQNLYNTEYTIPFLKEILRLIQQGHYQDIPAIQLYHWAYLALTQPQNMRHFELLKQNLLKQETLLPLKEKRNLYTLAINYCIKRINSNESQHFIQQVFQLYKQGLKNEILLDNGMLSRFTYKNIVAVGLRLKEYDWTATYIPTYAKYLEVAYRENYQHYTTSKLYFSKGEYDAAMQRLIQVEYDDLFLNLDAKTMLMKIYYETQSYNALDAFFHSFIIYLQRKEIMGYHRENYLNIIRLTRKLLELPPNNKKAYQQLSEAIHSIQPLTEREWLSKQLSKI